MEVRLARPDDHDAIGQLTVEAYAALAGGEEVLGDYEDELRDVAGRAVECDVLVAVNRHRTLLGAVTYVPGPDTVLSEFSDADAAGIRMLAVAPGHQGSGVGRALTEACIERARRDGRRKIVLHSTELMKVARTMYEKLGFVAEPERDEWVTEPPFSEAQPLHLIGYVLTL
ncbi:MAG: GNAT family N-acetyltransferase [Ilumatobacteraceae bacterium]